MHFPREDSEIITGDISSAAKTSRPFGTQPFSLPLLLSSPSVACIKGPRAIVKCNYAPCKRSVRDLCSARARDRERERERERERNKERLLLFLRNVFAPNFSRFSRDNIFFNVTERKKPSSPRGNVIRDMRIFLVILIIRRPRSGFKYSRAKGSEYRRAGKYRNTSFMPRGHEI